MGTRRGITGYGGTLRLLNVTAWGTGSSKLEAKRHAERAMWEVLCRRSGARSVRFLDQGEEAGASQMGQVSTRASRPNKTKA